MKYSDNVSWCTDEERKDLIRKEIELGKRLKKQETYLKYAQQKFTLKRRKTKSIKRRVSKKRRRYKGRKRKQGYT